MSVWDDKDSPLSPKYGEQRFFRPARVVLHGDQTRASSYLPLARNLLGQLVQQDHVLGGLPQSGRWVRMIDPHTAVNAPPASLTTMGVTAHVGYSHGQPHIEIWVRDVGDEELCPPRFGSSGKRRLSGIEEQANVAACEYMDPYFDLSLAGGVYLGPYKSLFILVRATDPPLTTREYPHHNGVSTDTYFHSWRSPYVEVDTGIGTPFGGDGEQKLTFYSNNRSSRWPGPYYYNAPLIRALRAEITNDKIVIVTTVIIFSGYNVDPSGLAQPVPVIAIYNLTTGTVLDTYIFPVPSLSASPVPGLVYLTPEVIAVDDTSFYALCMSHSGYAIEGQIDLDQAGYEANVFYSNNDGATYTILNIRPLIDAYIDADQETVYTSPAGRFNSFLQQEIQLASVFAMFLAIGNNEALLSLRLARIEDRVIDGVFYRGTRFTNRILKCTPSGVSAVYTNSAWWGTPQGETFATIKEEINALQYWVYLGNDVILGKFIEGHRGIDLAVHYRRSFDRGDTWEEVPATGLPSFRMNQFFGDFTLIEPYEVDEDGNVISAGVVLTTAYDSGVYRSYVSTDVGETWVEAGALSNTEEFYRVDSILIGDGGGNFSSVRYFGDIEDPAPFDPALPELMQRPQP